MCFEPLSLLALMAMMAAASCTSHYHCTFGLIIGLLVPASDLIVNIEFGGN